MGEATTAETLTALFQRCHDGDTAAFTRIYQRLSRGLFGTALRILGRPEEAEDATQEAFLTLYDRRTELDPAQAGAWLKRVLVNHCIDRLRRRRTRPEAELVEEISPAPRRPEGLTLDLQAAVKRLPHRARLVFLLHDVEGYRHRDVAEIMEVSEGASKSQLFRARELLRAHLSGAPQGAS